ncbi:MAG: hypothetical protein LBT09_02845 [Planctomycetaceae bacterium]|nr:hypothetical protein [Planctomycetaceae bacterium]
MCNYLDAGKRCVSIRRELREIYQIIPKMTSGGICQKKFRNYSVAVQPRKVGDPFAEWFCRN